MADRQAFLDHVREQAAKGRAYRVALNPHATHTQSYVGCGPDKVGALLTEWQGVGGGRNSRLGLVGGPGGGQSVCAPAQLPADHSLAA